WPVVHRLGVPVCYDLRQADLQSGGQGAPITPIADLVLYRMLPRPSLIVNLGGICNVTRIGSDDPSDIRGGDIGPCNLLLDGLCRRLFDLPYDRGGALAARGQPVARVIDAIGAHPYFTQGGARSTGREDFH